MKITYYLEVLSSWCYWCEPTWTELKQRYAGKMEFTWKIALMRPEDFPVSAAQTEWFYQRSGTIMRSPFMLNSGWYEADRKGLYNAPNLVAEAGKDFGITDDTLRLALAHAAVREGQKVGDIATAVTVGSAATGLDPTKLRQRAESAEVLRRVEESTAEFHAHRIAQRPAFILEDEIGDKAVFSGLVRIEPLAATVEAMIADSAAYRAHRAHFGPPPSA